MAKDASNLSVDIRKHLELRGWLTWRNGCVFVRGRTIGTPGLSDVMALKRGKLLCVEVKATKGDRVRPDQAAFLQQAEQHGAAVLVAHSLEETIEYLRVLESHPEQKGTGTK